jgi:hypothetical protein
MKRVVLIPIEPGKKDGDRRRNQRRTSVPRRIRPSRSAHVPSGPVLSGKSERRNSSDRRRLPDRRLGLSLDLDWSELE